MTTICMKTLTRRVIKNQVKQIYILCQSFFSECKQICQQIHIKIEGDFI